MLCPSRSDSTNIQQFNYVHHQSAVMLWKSPFWVGSTASLTITFLSCLILFVAHRTLALVWTYWINAISSLADSRDSLALINICKHKKRPRSDYLTRYISYFSNFLLHFIKLYLHFKLCWVLGFFFPALFWLHKNHSVFLHIFTQNYPTGHFSWLSPLVAVPWNYHPGVSAIFWTCLFQLCDAPR